MVKKGFVRTDRRLVPEHMKIVCTGLNKLITLMIKALTVKSKIYFICAIRLRTRIEPLYRR